MADIRRTRPPASPAQEALWNIISTLILAVWLAVGAGWPWAVGAVVGVFVHEYGHVLAMDGLGLGPAKMRIIPFLGGAATPAIAPETEFKDVLVSLAGPSFGLLAVLPFYAAAGITRNSVWLEAALPVAVINLLNLIPAPPLDGSRALGPVLARIHPQVERGVLVLVGAGAVWWCLQHRNFLIAVFIAISVYGALSRPTVRPFALKLTGLQQGLSLLLYLAVAALCVAALGFTLHLMDVPTAPVALMRRAGIVR
jgi:Zn-dependent protease